MIKKTNSTDVDAPKKYNNKKVVYNGITFDSKLELEYYLCLLQLHKPEDVQIQPKFELQPHFTKHGKLYRKIEYIADFAVGDVVYDVKGMVMEVFAVKRKLFEFRYPTKVLCAITKCPIRLRNTYGLWIDIDDLAKERRKTNKLKKGKK